MDSEELDDARTHDIIGCAMAVHRELGPGILEAYQHALRVELTRKAIPHEVEVAIPVFYQGEPLGVPFRADLLCFGEVLVELKALPAVGRREWSQVRYYLKATGLAVGLLLNFGEPSLRVERVSAAGVPLRVSDLNPRQSPNPKSPEIPDRMFKPSPSPSPPPLCPRSS